MANSNGFVSGSVGTGSMGDNSLLGRQGKGKLESSAGTHRVSVVDKNKLSKMKENLTAAANKLSSFFAKKLDSSRDATENTRFLPSEIVLYDSDEDSDGSEISRARSFFSSDDEAASQVSASSIEENDLDDVQICVSDFEEIVQAIPLPNLTSSQVDLVKELTKNTSTLINSVNFILSPEDLSTHIDASILDDISVVQDDLNSFMESIDLNDASWIDFLDTNQNSIESFYSLLGKIIQESADDLFNNSIKESSKPDLAQFNEVVELLNKSFKSLRDEKAVYLASDYLQIHGSGSDIEDVAAVAGPGAGTAAEANNAQTKPSSFKLRDGKIVNTASEVDTDSDIQIYGSDSDIEDAAAAAGPGAGIANDADNISELNDENLAQLNHNNESLDSSDDDISVESKPV